jgi:D-psicose/D-tagatose/L-ribulose 3-epimerase
MALKRGMKFGAHSFIWTGHFVGRDDSIFAEAAACGYDGVEIALAGPEAIDWPRVALAQDHYKLSVVLCATQPPGLSLASADPSTRKAAIAHVTAIMERARALGSDIVTGPMLNPVGALSGAPPRDDEKAALLNSSKSLAEIAERMGMRLALEPLNRFQGYLLTRVNDGIELCRQTGSSSIGLLLDLFHMNIEETSIASAIRRAGQHCFHIHVSACDRGIPGSDTFDWGSLCTALVDINYQEWITAETFCFTEPDAAAKAHIWHPPKMTSRNAAAASIAHLRNVFSNNT